MTVCTTLVPGCPWPKAQPKMPKMPKQQSTSTRPEICAYIMRNPRCSARQIADAIGKSIATVVGQLKGLREKGYVQFEMRENAGIKSGAHREMIYWL